MVIEWIISLKSQLLTIGQHDCYKFNELKGMSSLKYKQMCNRHVRCVPNQLCKDCRHNE